MNKYNILKVAAEKAEEDFRLYVKETVEAKVNGTFDYGDGRAEYKYRDNTVIWYDWTSIEKLQVLGCPTEIKSREQAMEMFDDREQALKLARVAFETLQSLKDEDDTV